MSLRTHVLLVAGLLLPQSLAAQQATPDSGDFGAEGAVTSESNRTATDARSTTTERDLHERQPRSAPDALRFEPGVAIQQTAHGQASVYLRAMTGQQVVHLFDGIRLNNGIYRQGPNQYFFTVDRNSLSSLEIVRGGASVHHGSDALGGAVSALPQAARMEAGTPWAEPRLELRYGSADRELGIRGAIAIRLTPRTWLRLGGGYRALSLLRSGGVVTHPDPSGGTGRGDIAPWIPRFAEEAEYPNDPSMWHTQLGTGFREGTYDARLEHALTDRLTLIAASYGYEQRDAPRTDQCPPQEAPDDECLMIDRQSRNLTYLALRGRVGPFASVKLQVSYQHHVEDRSRNRPRSGVRFNWHDALSTVGIGFSAETKRFALSQSTGLSASFGFDAYRDQMLASTGERTYTDVNNTAALSRGQYLEGAHYLTSGVFAETSIDHASGLGAFVGGRAALVAIAAAPDAESGSAAVEQSFGAAVGRAGVSYEPARWIKVAFEVDQGFRAPNLDDMTARQQVGPGFQFENPNLTPERSLTTELGLELKHDWLTFSIWGFSTRIDDAITRIVRNISDCPASTPECRSSRTPFQLINAPDVSRIFGLDGGATLWLPRDVSVRGTVSYAFGEGPSLADSLVVGERVPLSRVPPLQGTVEARYRHEVLGVWASAAFRWSLAQTRLAIADASDPRIPNGGTPGYAVFDLRLGWDVNRWLSAGMVLENLGDAAYRVHGSSIQGPGRSVNLFVRVGR